MAEAVQAGADRAVTVFRRKSIMLVTDRRRLAPDARTAADEVRALEEQLEAAIDAGIDYIQIREPELDARSMVQLTSRVVQQSRGTRTRVLVNDRADVALASGADGVHLKQDGPAADIARALASGWIVGRSIHAAADTSVIGAADYAIFGTMFASGSKGVDHRTAGLDALARVVTGIGRPVLAIGGITPDNAGLIADAGAAGVAAIGAFLPEGRAPGALGVREAVQRFRAIAAFQSDLLE